MTDEQKRIIEINGIKVEVDLRTAKRVDAYKVGDLIKVLVKNYSDKYTANYGVIMDFVEFKKLPSIEVLAVDPSSWTGDLKFYTINDKSEFEIAPLSYADALFTKDDILKRMDEAVEEKRHELKTLEMKRRMFLDHFGHYFKMVEEESLPGEN